MLEDRAFPAPRAAVPISGMSWCQFGASSRTFGGCSCVRFLRQVLVLFKHQANPHFLIILSRDLRDLIHS